MVKQSPRPLPAVAKINPTFDEKDGVWWLVLISLR